MISQVVTVYGLHCHKLVWCKQEHNCSLHQSIIWSSSPSTNHSINQVVSLIKVLVSVLIPTVSCCSWHLLLTRKSNVFHAFRSQSCLQSTPKGLTLRFYSHLSLRCYWQLCPKCTKQVLHELKRESVEYMFVFCRSAQSRVVQKVQVT